MSAKYWIMKSEPSEFSIDDLKLKKKSRWDGIRNYQVRNMLRDQIKVGDRAFFYHSSTNDIGIAGEMEVIKAAYPDPTQFDNKSKYYDQASKLEAPRWLAVDVKFVAKFDKFISLSEMKLDPALATLPVLKKGNRLSVMPITKNEYNRLKNTQTKT